MSSEGIAEGGDAQSQNIDASGGHDVSVSIVSFGPPGDESCTPLPSPIVIPLSECWGRDSSSGGASSGTCTGHIDPPSSEITSKMKVSPGQKQQHVIADKKKRLRLCVTTGDTCATTHMVKGDEQKKAAPSNQEEEEYIKSACMPIDVCYSSNSYPGSDPISSRRREEGIIRHGCASNAGTKHDSMHMLAKAREAVTSMRADAEMTHQGRVSRTQHKRIRTDLGGFTDKRNELHVPERGIRCTTGGARAYWMTEGVGERRSNDVRHNNSHRQRLTSASDYAANKSMYPIPPQRHPRMHPMIDHQPLSRPPFAPHPQYAPYSPREPHPPRSSPREYPRSTHWPSHGAAGQELHEMAAPTGEIYGLPLDMPPIRLKGGESMAARVVESFEEKVVDEVNDTVWHPLRLWGKQIRRKYGYRDRTSFYRRLRAYYAVKCGEMEAAELDSMSYSRLIEEGTRNYNERYGVGEGQGCFEACLDLSSERNANYENCSSKKARIAEPRKSGKTAATKKAKITERHNNPDGELPKKTNVPRRVEQCDPSSFAVLQTHESCSEAARITGINRSKLSRLCRKGGGFLQEGQSLLQFYRYADE